jgi:hypothetical protein
MNFGTPLLPFCRELSKEFRGLSFSLNFRGCLVEIWGPIQSRKSKDVCQILLSEGRCQVLDARK